MHGAGSHKDDILSMMLKYEEENPNYTIEEQIDDFLTFFIAGKNCNISSFFVEMKRLYTHLYPSFHNQFFGQLGSE